MSAPFFTIGFSMLWVLLLISLTGLTFCKAALTLSFLTFCFVGIRKRFSGHDKSASGFSVTSTELVSAAVCLACILFMFKTYTSFYPVTEIAHCSGNEKVSVTGQITGILPKSDSGNRRYVVKVKSLSYAGKNEKIDIPIGGMKLILTSKFFKGELNAVISFDGKLYALGDTRQMQNYYKAKGTYVGAYIYEEAETTDFSDYKSSVALFDRFAAKTRVVLSDVRNYSEKTVYKYLPDDYAAVVLGMLIGVKEEIPDEYYESFTRAGIVHLFSVSGFHMSLWSEAVYKFFLRRGTGKRFSALMSIFFVFAFMGVTGLSRSTVRAGIMMTVFFAGRMLFMDSDSLNSLGFSAFIIVLLNPFCAGDIGFLLSFFSTLGIVIGVKRIMNPIYMYLRRINDYVIRERVGGAVNEIAVSICAFVFTFPIIVIYIGEASIIAPLTNLLTSTAASATVFLSGIGVILSLLPLSQMICYPIFLASGLLTKYISVISAFLSDIPYLYAKTDAEFIAVALAAVLVLCGAAFLLPRESDAREKSGILSHRAADGRSESNEPSPITFREIYTQYDSKARLVFWLSVIIFMSGIFTYLYLNSRQFIV